MIINHLERLFVTNDAATIIKELDVAHPAAKLLVLASQQQEQEVKELAPPVFHFLKEALGNQKDILSCLILRSSNFLSCILAHTISPNLLQFLIPYMNLINLTNLINLISLIFRWEMEQTLFSSLLGLSWNTPSIY